MLPGSTTIAVALNGRVGSNSICLDTTDRQVLRFTYGDDTQHLLADTLSSDPLSPDAPGRYPAARARGRTPG